jgi:ketosteroid isomerase-like protein
MIELTPSTLTYGRDARARLAETLDLGREGARAALETFYCAFNSRDVQLLTAVWLDHPLVQMDDPAGGLLRGRDAIAALYSTFFTVPGRGWVELEEVLEVWTPANVVFAGRERGEYVTASEIVPLAIRTTRCFAYVGTSGGWRLVHHHGSLDDPDLLARYRIATGAPAAT